MTFQESGTAGIARLNPHSGKGAGKRHRVDGSVRVARIGATQSAYRAREAASVVRTINRDHE